MFSTRHEPPYSLEEEMEIIINHRSYFIAAINLSALMFWNTQAIEGRFKSKIYSHLKDQRSFQA